MKIFVLIFFLIASAATAQELSQKWLYSGLTPHAITAKVSPSGKYIHVYDYGYHKLINLATKKVEIEHYADGYYKLIAFLESDNVVLIQDFNSTLATLNFQTGEFQKLANEKYFGDIVSHSISTTGDTLAFAYNYYYGQRKYSDYSYGVFIKDLTNNREVFLEDSTFSTTMQGYAQFGYADFLALAPSGKRIAIYNRYDYDSTYLNIYELKDLNKGPLQFRIRFDSLRQTTGMVFTPDSKHILTTHSSGKIYQWNASTGECEYVNRLHDTTISFNDIYISDSIVRILNTGRTPWNIDDVTKHDTIYRYNFITHKIIDSIATGQFYKYSVDTGLHVSVGIDKKSKIIINDLATNASTNLSDLLMVEHIKSFYSAGDLLFSQQADSNDVNLRSADCGEVIDTIKCPANSILVNSHKGDYYLIINKDYIKVYDFKTKEQLWSSYGDNEYRYQLACFAQNDSSVWVVSNAKMAYMFSTQTGKFQKLVSIRDKNVTRMASIEVNADNTELLAYLLVLDSASGGQVPYIARIGMDGNFVKSKSPVWFNYDYPNILSYIDDNFILGSYYLSSDYSYHWFCARRETMDTLFSYKIQKMGTNSGYSSTCSESKELKGFFITNSFGDIVFYHYNSPDPVWQTSLNWPIAGAVLRADSKELFVGSFDASIRCFDARNLINFLSAEDEPELAAEGSCFYPNPVGDLIRFRPGTEARSIRIINTLGREVLSAPFAESLYVGELPQGVYFLVLEGRAYKFVKK